MCGATTSSTALMPVRTFNITQHVQLAPGVASLPSGNRAADPPAESPATGCNCTALIVGRLTADGPAANAQPSCDACVCNSLLTDAGPTCEIVFKVDPVYELPRWEWRSSVTDPRPTNIVYRLGHRRLYGQAHTSNRLKP